MASGQAACAGRVTKGRGASAAGTCSTSISSGRASTTGPGRPIDRDRHRRGRYIRGCAADRRFARPTCRWGRRTPRNRPPESPRDPALPRATSPTNRIIGCESCMRDVDADAGIGRARTASDESHAGAAAPAAPIAPSAQAMKATPPSCRQVTTSISGRSGSASSTARKLSPGTVKIRSHPCSARQSTSKAAALFVELARVESGT